VIDPVGTALGSAATHSAWAFPASFVAGASTSVGPCVAPRYLAVAALADGQRRTRALAAFAAGIVVAYVTLGAGAGVLTIVFARARWIDAGLSVILLAVGLVALWRDDDADCTRHDHAVPAGGAFMLGAMSALVISPCCTPFAVAIVGLGTAMHDPAATVVLLALFAAGHALPAFAVGASGMRVARRLRALAGSDAPRVIGGSLTVALGAYYGLLA
jgi:thiol:disulfide interchange protein DsbD